MNVMERTVVLLSLLICPQSGFCAEPINVWPDLAPGETTNNIGAVLPFRSAEQPRVTRVTGITCPTFTVHPANNPNGSAAVILPGGGFRKVVPDKEGTEAAEWLNHLGITAFVVSYRTTDKPTISDWRKPLQDAQRTLSLVRDEASRWGLDRERIGLIGFSAGGQVAARLLSDTENRLYERIDHIDDVPYRPDFSVLVYPWKIYDADRDSLSEGIMVTENNPPTFIVHTDDDASSSVGAALYYAGLRKQQISAELHVYGNGGHGYGLRPVPGSQISSWPDHAAHWLATQQLLNH